jgi:hypothetical protein
MHPGICSRKEFGDTILLVRISKDSLLFRQRFPSCASATIGTINTIERMVCSIVQTSTRLLTPCACTAIENTYRHNMSKAVLDHTMKEVRSFADKSK